MLNANMRTDILRHVHGGIEKRKDSPAKKSPLVMLIESIEDVVASFFVIVVRNAIEQLVEKEPCYGS